MLCVPVGVASASQSCAAAPLGDAELSLLEVVLEDRGRTRLEEIITSYATPEGSYLPLGMLAQALQFPIDINPSVTEAEGWFLQPDRTFRLGINDCTVSIAGRRESVDPAMVAQMEDDIYVRASLLETWFPVSLNVDSSMLRLLITAQEPLPMQKRRERREHWERMGSRTETEREPSELQAVPYRLMDWPFVDLTAQWHGQRLASDDRVTSDRYKLVAAGDFLMMNTLVSAQAVDGEMRDTFVTLSRRDPYHDLLGPLHASEIALGDIATARDPLVANNQLGRGLHVSNRPLDRPQEFDRFNLQGELPLGWDVELYRNGQLVAFQSGETGSRYDFVDIPLEFGINNFRLVFYGPNGQVREESLQRVIGQDMIQPGDHQYLLTAMEERELEGSSFTSELEPVQSEERVFFGYDYGVTQALSLGAGTRRLTLDGVMQDYRSAHMNLALPYLFTRLEGVSQVQGGEAYSAQLSTRVLGLDVAAESSRFEGFDSERVRTEPVPGDLLERNAVRLGARLPSFPGTGLAFATELQQFVGSEGNRYEAFNRTSLGTRYGTMTHLYEFDRIETGNFTTDHARQRLLFSTYRKWAALRGEVVQELEPERFIRSAGVSVDWPIGERGRARIAATRLPAERTNTYSAGINWRFDYFLVGVNIAMDSAGETTGGFVLSTSFIRDPGGRDWQLSPSASTHSGALGVHVFLDENGNGQWDVGERPVEGARIKTNDVPRTSEANADGYIFIPGLPAYQSVEVAVDRDSLENPFWVVDFGRRSVVPRPGRTARLQLPVTPTGSIEGTVLVPSHADPRLAEGRSIHLLTAGGAPVQETVSAYDGFYSFDGIPPGFYRIRMGDRGIERPFDPDDLLIEIHGEMQVIRSADLVLRPQQRTEVADRRTPPDVTTRLPMPTQAQNDAEAGGYTIQLMAASTEYAVRNYILRHDLDAHYVQTRRHGRPWFQVLFNRYPTADAARDAIRNLPHALKAAGPYIRPLASIEGTRQRVTSATTKSGQAALPPEVLGESWVRSRPAGHFTIQVVALRNERDAREFIRENGLLNTAAFFRSPKDGVNWYAVVYGEFDTQEQARRAANELPATLRESGTWVRSFGSIHESLEK